MLRVSTWRWRTRRRGWYAQITDTNIRKRIGRLLGILFILIACHVAAMMVFEGMALWPAFWLTMTSVTTVGYGDVSAQTTAGQLSTVVFIYLAGISLLAQVVGEYIDFRIDRRERMLDGRWRWHKMNKHLLIVNTPKHNGDMYLQRLVGQIRNTPSLTDIPIQVLTPAFPNGLPNGLREMGVVHRTDYVNNRKSLEMVNVQKAAFVVVLTDDAYDSRSDSSILDVLEHLREIETDAYVIAECVNDENKERFKRIRANAVIRPVRAYPEILVRAISAPGSEQILEDLFTHDGAHTQRYDINLTHGNWGEVACKIVAEGLGTPMGYVNQQDQLVLNPSANSEVAARALFLLVDHEVELSSHEVKSCLASSFQVV